MAANSYLCSEHTPTQVKHTTQAIVITTQAQRDNRSIVHLYTRSGGRMRYAVYGHRWHSLLQPLALVEITANQTTAQAMPTLESVALCYVPNGMQRDVRRQCVAMFVAEVIEKTMRMPMSDECIYDYLSQTCRAIDTTNDIEHLPGHFLTHLSELAGYGGEPMDEYRDLKSLEVIRTIFDG